MPARILGGGAALPSVSFAAAPLNASASNGSAAGQASVSGGYGGSWSMTTTAPLTINPSTGALTTTGAVAQGSYSAALTYTFSSNGETYTVSETVSIAVSAAPVVAPTVTTAPSLSTSSPVVGTAITPTRGVYTGSPAVTAQWFYADTGALISGAPTTAGTAYTPATADTSHPLKYIETATNSAGSVASAAPTTAAVAASTALPALSSASYVAEYDATAGDAGRMSLSQGQYTVGRPFTSDFPANRATAIVNRQTGSGALASLSLIPAGVFASNGPIYQSGYIDAVGGLECRENEKGIGSASGVLPLTTASVGCAAGAATLRRGDRSLNGNAPSYGALISLGTKLILGHGGKTPPAGGTTGQLGLYNNGTGGTWNPLASGATTHQGQTFTWAMRWIGSGASAIGTQQPGTVRVWINGSVIGDFAFNADSDGRIMVGNINGAVQATYNAFDGPIHVPGVFASGAVLDSEMASIISAINARVKGTAGTTYGVPARETYGQSNAASMLGAAASATLAQDYAQVRGDTMHRELWGIPTFTDIGAFQAGVSITALAAKPEAESANTWANMMTLNATKIAELDDVNGATTDPSTWTTVTVTGSLGARVHPPLQSYAHGADMFCMLKYLGENYVTATGATTGYNRHVLSSPYAGYSSNQFAAHYLTVCSKEVDFLRADTGNQNLLVATTLLGGNQSWYGDLIRIAQIAFNRANPSKAFMATENPWWSYESDVTSSIHCTYRSYDALARITSRAQEWKRKAAGLTPTGARSAGPTYGAFPRIQSLSAPVGQSYVDVTFSNPSGATGVSIPAMTATTGDTNALASLATTGDVTSGSFAIANVASLASVYVGASISGAGIPANSRIASISGTTIIFTNGAGTAATATATGEALTIVRNASIINVPSSAFANLKLGQQVFGSGVRVNAYVAYLDQASGVVTMQTSALSAVTGQALTIGNARKGWEVWRSNQGYGASFAGTTTTSATDGQNTLTYEATGFELTGTPTGDVIGTPTLQSLSSSAIVIRIPTGNPNVSGAKVTLFYGRENANQGVYTTFNDVLTDNAATACAAEPNVESFGRMNMPMAIEPAGVVVQL